MKGILVVKSKLKDRKEGEDDDKKDDGKAEDKPETPGDGGEADEGRKVKSYLTLAEIERGFLVVFSLI